MTPGYKYTSMEYEGECLRESFACATGIARRTLPYIDPHNTSSGKFWRDWEDLIWDAGFVAEVFHPNGYNEPEGFWIAFVPAYPGERRVYENHAVVMRGKKLWHDPNQARPRKHRPHAFYKAWRLIPLDN